MELNSNVEVSDLIKKYRNTILNILIIILAAIISVNIYKKQLKKIYLLNSQKEMEIKKNSEFENISKLEKKNNYFKSYLAKKDAGLIINTITDIAKELGITVVSIRPENELKFAQYSKWPFEITLIISSYHDLGKFISRIENSNNVYLIETISIKRKSRTTGLIVNLRFSSIAVN